MTTVNRKRIRLIEKLKGLSTNMLAIKEAPQGAANPTSTAFDPDAFYVSRETLIELLEEGWAPGELTEPVPEEDEQCSACSGSGYYDVEGSPPCGSCNGTGYKTRD